MNEIPKLFLSKATIIARSEAIDLGNLRSSFSRALKLFKDKEQLIVAEIGVFEGINAKYMCMFCDKIKLYLVDSWDNVTIFTGGPVQGEDYSNLLKNITRFNLYPHKDNVVFMDKNSLDAVKDFADEFFDYVYIDGDHEYEPVKKDLLAWWPKVKTGGIMGGHDVIMPDISKALDEFVKENKILDDKWGKEDSTEGRSDFWIYK